MENMLIAGSGGCFPKGALVQLEGGRTKRIEDVRLGDEVLSFDEWGYVTKSVVTETHYHAAPEPLIKVSYWQGDITITPNHWVLNALKTFSAIGELGINEALVDGMGNLRPIKSIRHVDPEPVYNLTVEPYHTFICDGIRVHNGGYRASYPTIGGSGGGGKKSGSSGMREDPDSLESTAKISVLDLIGEGEIGGLLYSGETITYDGEVRDKAAMSILLDDTPLMASDGSWNFEGVSFGYRNGTQNQSAISGFNDVEETVSVGVEVTKKGGGIVRTITNPNTDQIRVVVSVSALTKTDSKTGNISGSQVSYKFEAKHNDSNWVELGTHTIVGKTRSTYQRAHEYQLPKNMALGASENNVWNVRMTRLTDDSSSSLVANGLNWDSYSIVINSKLNYPNSALVGVTVNSEQFSSVPSRSYLVNGLKIKVPSNYTPPYRDSVPLARADTAGWHEAVYDGIWDGSFKTMVCSNPAWILYDLLTDERYGLGQFVQSENIDIGKLYKIGKYCDEFVPSGYIDDSGLPYMEPRFQVNTVIQQRTDAYKVVSDICSAFRGMAYWSGGEVCITADMPSDPVMKYTPANVIDGIFTYQGSARKDRHSVALVTWNNPDQYYQQEVEYIEDPEMVEKYGVRETEVVDFGCTSRGQARRAGLWLLYTEKYEADLISFDVGIDSSLVLPGDIIEIHDTVRAGKRMGGRIRVASTAYAELDSPIQIDSQMNFSVRLPDGTFAERVLADPEDLDNPVPPGEYSKVFWKEPLPAAPLNNAIWMCSNDALEPVIARVVAIKQKSSSTYTISALEHNPSKYDAVEKGLALDDPSTSIIDFSKVEKVTNLKVTEIQYTVSSGTTGLELFVSWTGSAYEYIVSYRRTGSISKETYAAETYDLGTTTETNETNLTITTTVDNYRIYEPDGFISTRTVTTVDNNTGVSESDTSSVSYSFGTDTKTVTEVGEDGQEVERVVETVTVSDVITANGKVYEIGSAEVTEDGITTVTDTSVTRVGNDITITRNTHVTDANGRNVYTTTTGERFVVGDTSTSTAELDEDGSVIYTTTTGEKFKVGYESSTDEKGVVTEVEITVDEAGVLTKTTTVSTPVQVPLTEDVYDDAGNLVLDESGNPVKQVVTDESGNPVMVDSFEKVTTTQTFETVRTTNTITTVEVSGNVLTQTVTVYDDLGTLLNTTSTTFTVVQDSETVSLPAGQYLEEYVVRTTDDSGTTEVRYPAGADTDVKTYDVTETITTEVATELNGFSVTKTTVKKDSATGKEIANEVESETYPLGKETTTGTDENGTSYTKRITTREVTSPSTGALTGYTIETRMEYSEVEYTENWTTVTTTLPSYEIMNAQLGTYEIQVQAVSIDGHKANPTSIKHTVTGETAAPGKPEWIDVRKRTYDLLCMWKEVKDSPVMGYEVRVASNGEDWTNAEIIQANIQATACVDDKDKPGTYIYYLKSINYEGVYCQDPAVFTLELEAPSSVTGFGCSQHGERIEFKWDKNPETDIVYYEIREGKSWGVSSLVTQVASTTYTTPVSPVSKTRTFWIKAVASPGIPSNVAVMTQLVTTSTVSNVVLDHDEASYENNWHGVHFHTTVSDFNLFLKKGALYGEYVHPITLAFKMNAPNYIDAQYDVTEQGGTTWEDHWRNQETDEPVDVDEYAHVAQGYDELDENGNPTGKYVTINSFEYLIHEGTSTVNENGEIIDKATGKIVGNAVWADTGADYEWGDEDSQGESARPWVTLGDNRSVDIAHQISYFVGYDSMDESVIMGFPLEEDAVGKNVERVVNENDIDQIIVTDIQPASADNVAYEPGRFGNSAVVSTNTILDWEKTLPEEFFIHFWFIPETVTAKSVIFEFLADNGKTMTLGINHYFQTIYLEDSDGNLMEMYDYYPEVGDRILFGILQERDSRTLYVGRLGLDPKMMKAVERTDYLNADGETVTDAIKQPDGTFVDSNGEQLVVKQRSFAPIGTIKKFGFVLSESAKLV